MKKDFAIRLDQAYSCLNPAVATPSEPTPTRVPVTQEHIDQAKECLLPLVKEAHETKIVVRINYDVVRTFELQPFEVQTLKEGLRLILGGKVVDFPNEFARISLE